MFVRFFPVVEQDMYRVLAQRNCHSGIEILTPRGFEPLANVRGISQIIGKASALYLWRMDIRSDHHLVLKSNDGGKTWSAMRGDLYGLRKSLSQIAVTKDSTLLAGTSGGGVYRCDATLRCIASNSGFVGPMPAYPVVLAGDSKLSVLTLVTAPYWYYPVGNFLYKSIDGGKYWQDLTLLAGTDDSVRTLELHPSDPNTLILYPGVATSVYTERTQSFSLSHDGGESWIRRATPFPFNNLVFDPSIIHTLYASVLVDDYSLKLYKSTNDGVTFTKIGKIPMNSGDSIFKVVIDKNNSGILFLCGQQGNGKGLILKSSDGGRTYTRIMLKQNMLLNEWAPLPGANSYLAADENGFVYRTTNGFVTWEEISRVGSWDFNFTPSLYAADNTGRHFYAIRDGHLFESTDSARNWTDITPNFINSDYDQITSMTDPRRRPIFLSTTRGIFTLRSKELHEPQDPKSIF